MHVSINYTDSEGNFVKNLLLDPAEVVAIMNSDIIRLNDDDLKPIKKTFGWIEIEGGISVLSIECERINTK